MGEKAQKIFEYVEQEAGSVAALRVVLHSRIPGYRAAEIEDNAKNIEKLIEIAKKVLNRKHLDLKL